MAALVIASRRYAGYGLSHIIYQLVSAVIEWNDARITRKALSALSDHELNDIGLHRGDIEDIASRRVF